MITWLKNLITKIKQEMAYRKRLKELKKSVTSRVCTRRRKFVHVYINTSV